MHSGTLLKKHVIWRIGLRKLSERSVNVTSAVESGPYGQLDFQLCQFTHECPGSKPFRDRRDWYGCEGAWCGWRASGVCQFAVM
jgi:hypothetical protein